MNLLVRFFKSSLPLAQTLPSLQLEKSPLHLVPSTTILQLTPRKAFLDLFQGQDFIFYSYRREGPSPGSIKVTTQGKLFSRYPQSHGCMCPSLFLPQRLSAEPHDLGAGEDPFSSPGQ